MTIASCINGKIKAGTLSKVRGKEAVENFRKYSDGMIAQGIPPNQAYAMAAEVIAKAAKTNAMESKHRLLAQMQVAENLRKMVDQADSVKNLAMRVVDDLDFDSRAIRNDALATMGDFLHNNSTKLSGKTRDPATVKDVLKALRGEQVGSEKARGFAAAIAQVFDGFRVKLNAHGYNIKKRENWGFPQGHDAVRIGRAEFDQWSKDLREIGFNWLKMIDPRTGDFFTKVPDAGYQSEFMRGAYDNIVYGRGSKSPEFGVGKGENPLERARVFEFESVDGWLKYNEKYGTSDPMNALLNHIDYMSREVAVARRFGPDADTALKYLNDLVAERGRKEDIGQVAAAKGMLSEALSKNMLRYFSGSTRPSNWYTAKSAKVFATSRAVLQGALLDRAVVISAPSDLNNAQLLADVIKMNSSNMLTTYTKLLADSVKNGGATRDDLLRQRHIANFFGQPTVTANGVHSDVAPAAWAQYLTNTAMRIQGMNAHTDSLKLAVKKSLAGHFMSVKDLSFDALDPAFRQNLIDRGGITARDWDTFRNSGGVFTDADGATFLDPYYWKQFNTMDDPNAADELWLKMASYMEKFTELAVPSGSLIAKGMIEPAAYGLSPGGALYELIKSAGMFKSFPAAFVVNQVRIVSAMTNYRFGTTGNTARTLYVTEMLARASLVGAFAMQIGDLMLGRDPQEMDTDFWGRAVLRGGGLGPVGDLLALGETSWGGGLGTYLGGPMVAAVGDIGALTAGNVMEAIGDYRKDGTIDTNFVKELGQNIKRYTPMAQTPALLGGSLFDRAVVDQMVIALDPEAYDELLAAAQRRANRYNSGDYWLPGDLAPTRAPDLMNAFGQ